MYIGTYPAKGITFKNRIEGKISGNTYSEIGLSNIEMFTYYETLAWAYQGQSFTELYSVSQIKVLCFFGFKLKTT